MGESGGDEQSQKQTQQSFPSQLIWSTEVLNGDLRKEETPLGVMARTGGVERERRSAIEKSYSCFGVRRYTSNETTAEIPTHGALEVQTLEDLMDAITSIVTIGMAGVPRAAIRHLSFTRFWADRLAELADRQASAISLELLLRIDPREVARGLASASVL